MKDTNRLTEWVIGKIKTEYPDDIALLIAVDGFSVNNDGHGEPFDYFVPVTERGNELAQTFIIGGVGNDLYPRSWERCERTANLDDWATFCLGLGKILYSRSKEDAERFEAVRYKLFANLRNPEFIYMKALERLDSALDMYRTMMFEDRLYKVRGLAGFIHYYLAMGVAYLNHTYIADSGWNQGMLTMYAKWEFLPMHFLEYYELILAAKTVGELRSISYLLITSTRQFIAERKPQSAPTVKQPDYRGLADWYQELRTTWNRIYYYCKTGNSDAVFLDACNLQNEFSIMNDEFDFFHSFNAEEQFNFGEMNLLGVFDAGNLEPLCKRANELEKIIISAIESHGINIRCYKTLEEFLADKKQC
jgi:hypothetical protein